MRSIDTSDKPMGLGRCGERVLNTPTRCPFRRGGATLAFAHVVVVVVSMRWKWYRIHMCENSSRPSNACSGLVKIFGANSMHPTNCWAIDACRGTARLSPNTVRMVPIVLNGDDEFSFAFDSAGGFSLLDDDEQLEHWKFDRTPVTWSMFFRCKCDKAFNCFLYI